MRSWTGPSYTSQTQLPEAGHDLLSGGRGLRRGVAHGGQDEIGQALGIGRVDGLGADGEARQLPAAPDGGLDELAAEYDELCDAQPDGPLPGPVEDIGFLLEEYRVQLFAQRLGTSRTVSPKRIRRAIARAAGDR